MVTDLKSTLDTIRSLLEDDGDTEDPCLPLLKSLDSSFSACREAIEDIAKQLGLELDATSNEEPIRITFLKKATWPWKEKGVGKIVQSLEKFKTIFILALHGETLQVVRAIQDRVEDVNGSTSYAF